MTPPVFLVLPASLSDDHVLVDGDEGRHAITVRRLAIGEVVQLSDGAGSMAQGQIVSITGKDSFVVAVDSVWTDPQPSPQVSVIQALIKGDRMDRAVESLTEVGVDSIIPWAAENCVVRWDEAQADKAISKLQRRAAEASKQSRRSRIAQIEPLVTKHTLRARLAEFDLVIVLHESAQRALPDVGLDAQSIALVVGPEGGIAGNELLLLDEVGATLVRMGPTVMRAGTAGTAALGWVLAAGGRWSKPEPRT